MQDPVDRILDQWRTEMPGIDPTPMGIIGRLSRAASAVESRLAETFKRHGLDASSFDVLATLRRSGSPFRVTPVALARDAMISTAAVAQRLNKLEKRGLILRDENPDDGRSTFVTLTPAGKALVEQALSDHLATERALLGNLSTEDQTLLAHLLGNIFTTASELSSARP